MERSDDAIKTTIRMAKHPNLGGYIFQDDLHARDWLLQEYTKGNHDKIVLERGVKSKEWCSECGNVTMNFKVRETLTVAQFLGEHP